MHGTRILQQTRDGLTVDGFRAWNCPGRPIGRALRDVEAAGRDREPVVQSRRRPESIAAAAGINERRANRLLALEGTSIRRLLMERRLIKYRAAFENPLQRRRSIAEPALSYGFRNLSHFTGAFKSPLGMTPGEYRQRAQSPAHEMTPQRQQRSNGATQCSVWGD